MVVVANSLSQKFNEINNSITAKMSEESLDNRRESIQSVTTALESLDPSADDPHKKGDKQKVEILLKPTGNAPIMKRKKWAVDAEKPISWIIEFMKKALKLEPNERLFLYVNQTFAPSPDQLVRNLYDCYSTEGKLVLHYCKTQAWG